MENTERKIISLIFSIETQFFALPVNNISAIIDLPEITKIPKSPDNIIGIINYRESIFKLFNLRVLFGFESVEKKINDFAELMDKRAEDHKNWLNTLENSVINKSQFTLTTDSHQCAFGKWYDSFQTRDLHMQDILSLFNRPHIKIHSIAEEIVEFQEKGKHKEALNLIEETKNRELKTMFTLFNNIKDTYRNSLREVAILLEHSGELSAVAADSVIAVEELDLIDLNSGSASFNSNISSIYINGFSHYKDSEFILHLNENEIFETISS